MSGESCFVCGFDNEHALEEHHIMPESLGGADDESNIATLCANCHRAITSMYSRWFFARLYWKFDEMDTPPELVRSNPPKGMKWNEENELVPDYEDGFDQVQRAYRLLERDLSYREIGRRVDMGNTTIRHLSDKRHLYEDYLSDGSTSNHQLPDWGETNE